MERYAEIRVLAPAIYGEVLLCQDKLTGELVAVKRMKISALERQVMTSGHGARVMEDVRFEKQVNYILQRRRGGRHPHILHMRSNFIDYGCEHFVFDYCPGGDLYDRVDRAEKLPNEEAATFFGQIISGVHFMHCNGIAHRDLSLENFLLDANDTVKLCDFGLATAVPSLRNDAVGKPFYMAPEVVSQQMYDPIKADVWSLGVVLFIMLTGIPLVELASDADSRFRILKARGLKSLLDMWQLTHLFTPNALDLLQQMLDTNPDTRMSLDQVMKHVYVGESLVQCVPLLSSKGPPKCIGAKNKGIKSSVMSCFRHLNYRPSSSSSSSSRKVLAAPTKSIAATPPFGKK